MSLTTSASLVDQRPALSKRAANLLIIVALAAAVVSAYWPVGRHDFVRYDDALYVTDNEQVKQGLTAEGVSYAFTTRYGGNWHPLTWLSHMLDVELFGLDPTGHHFMSVAIHALNAVILYMLLISMTRDRWLSGLVAGLFALHPLRVESVAWIAERKDVLSTLFGLLAVWAYAGYARRPAVGRYLLVMLLFALSLMSKAMLVTLPILLLLLDFWPLKRIGITAQPLDGEGGIKETVATGPGWSRKVAVRLIVEKLPLLALSAVISVITYAAQGQAGAMHKAVDLPLLDRLSNAAISYVRYLGKAFWPVDLAVLYPLPGGGWPLWATLGSLALLAAITVASVVLARRHPYVIVGWLWFVGTLVPVIGLVQVGAQSMADRYSYLPLIGVFIAVSWGGLRIFGRDRWRLLAVTAVMALGALWLGTRDQLRFWTNSRALYQHAIEVTRDNWVMNINMADLMEKEGRGGEAAAYIREAARIKPDDPITTFKVADVLVREGRVAEGMAGFKRVLELDPNQIEAMNNLAWLLATQADPRLRNGEEAVRLATRACELSGFKHAYDIDTLAAAYAEAGRFEDAVRTAERARDLAVANGLDAKPIVTHLEMFRAGQPLRIGAVPRPPS